MGKDRKSPQEKKALSLKRDRRNTFGESPHAARKSIPLRKAKENRRVRHENNQALANVEQLDAAALELVESSVRHNTARLGGWAKSPDEPLAAVIERKVARRNRNEGRKVRNRIAHSDVS
ncbi:hypothetical protein [Alteraurantiacibacter buctensis]|uniref:Uncharacterized protein n=1 Tax=Alteraurantiacibacter buctensis TaxID=1503981 RepID=A0A844Z1Z5_9SPHN|nr:hypothetical protein [Alteraurantiacibacter buctensis]MXO73180.1 hypothetical protein [Alteraurantiacibacter buctensis]